MRYVDGFVLTVPKKNLAAYRRMAAKGGKIWREHGAIEYVEAVGDDLAVKFGLPFPKLVKPKPGEAIVFSWIVYKSKASRNRVVAKVMKDKRLAPPADGSMPFDPKRMAYGGFKTIVDM
jgi:uncharacterized protein YbaA (DUF1428 family)